MLFLMDYLMNICAFPDLTQGEAIINEENLPVDAKKATLVVQAEINGEMYVLHYICHKCTGFEAGLINLLQSFVSY